MTMSISVGLLVDKVRRLVALYPRLVLSSGALTALLLLVHIRKSNNKNKKAKYVRTLAHLDKKEYDVIIVGGGTAGCVLAARLSEDPSLRVLMLEAGGSGAANPLSRIPSGFGQIFWTKDVYGFRTEPQIYAKGQKRFFPRAKMLGGCSSINAQMAQYGAPGDFDEWAALMADDSWAWSNLQKYFQKFETYLPDSRYPDVDSTERGNKGPVRVGYFNTVSQHSRGFLQACKEVGIPLIPDFNTSKGPIGASRIMTYVDPKGQRVSSETAYLTPDVLRRPNLTVAINASVTKVLFNGKRAVGVEFANGPATPRYTVRARKEIIVAGGAIHTPHILMLSGVGPAQQLEKFNIPVVLDVPGVGANLVDHPVVDLYLKDKLNDSVRALKPNSVSSVFSLLKNVALYQLKGTGKLATNFGECAAFVRSDDRVLFPEEDFPQTLEDSTSGSASPDLELFCTPMAYKEHGKIMFDMHTYALHCYLLRPTSRGAVLLSSADPWVLPTIDPNYFKDADDFEKVYRGFRLLMNISRATAMDKYLDHTDTNPELDHELHKKSEQEIRDIVKERVETVYHPASTCRMAPQDKGGVVDTHLKVYGLEGLRVCDASIFPWIPSGHTAGAVLAVAEKFADDLKRELTLKK
ncbi:hypothetical protein MKEN_00600000 [Mycena kentingensis (nom. inval.)]|nr:hypothetical protein MKEN_00600000 [Mycena kentingensis (nom. inval.)]